MTSRESSKSAEGEGQPESQAYLKAPGQYWASELYARSFLLLPVPPSFNITTPFCPQYPESSYGPQAGKTITMHKRGTVGVPELAGCWGFG